ncbi:MAG: glycerophosphodiester phosphodiesterase [Aliidiomarina sp.]|uniref:glycerophosphodiester phosphodiesterase n=1 Tax=Aliidiomarina sp. TaxID=1872439 RepID=UPI0025BA1992|nr:glycerophosphodiester phosphodiesterase [Aliidiomarina sp.]MCH8502552.1 glycerophosphodiester phosphodiesterase [Aliidiomarina sp.]
MFIFAHRGASFEAPENTLAAFQRALDAHADGIEIDIMQVGDEIYVFHDRYLRRLAAQPGRFQDLTAEQIERLRVFNQQPIPTLLQTLEFIAGKCVLNVELKGEISPELLSRALQRAQAEFGFQPEQLLVSSFNHHWLKTLQRHRPEIRYGALNAGCLLDYAHFAADLNAYSVHIDVDFITEAFVKDAHQRGLVVYVYTVDEPEDILELQKMGVDGIFSNHPQHARNVLYGHTSASPFYS